MKKVRGIIVSMWRDYCMSCMQMQAHSLRIIKTRQKYDCFICGHGGYIDHRPSDEAL